MPQPPARASAPTTRGAQALRPAWYSFTISVCEVLLLERFRRLPRFLNLLVVSNGRRLTQVEIKRGRIIDLASILPLERKEFGEGIPRRKRGLSSVECPRRNAVAKKQRDMMIELRHGLI